MKIKMKPNRISLVLWVPNSLLFSKWMARIICYGVKKNEDKRNVPLSPESMERLFSELRRIAKKNKGMVLVEVESAKGEQVRISI